MSRSNRPLPPLPQPAPAGPEHVAHSQVATVKLRVPKSSAPSEGRIADRPRLFWHFQSFAPGVTAPPTGKNRSFSSRYAAAQRQKLPPCIAYVVVVDLIRTRRRFGGCRALLLFAPEVNANVNKAQHGNRGERVTVERACPPRSPESREPPPRRQSPSR